MLQRWMITIVVSAVSCVLFSACGKKNYSPDEPLPTVYTPSVFISSQNKYLYAIDPVSGAEKWEYNLKNTTQATPLVIGDFLFVPSVSNMVKLNVNTGVEITVFNDPKFLGIASSPVTDGKMIYVATNPGVSTGKVIAINAATDAIVWEKDFSANISPSLCLYQAQLIVAKDDGVIECISKDNGTPIWLTSATIPLATGKPLYSSPSISYPYVYVGSTDGKLYALHLNDGTLGWSFTAGNVINSSPIVYGGNIIFGCNDNYIYCVDSIAKNIRWRFKTSDRVVSSAAAYRNVVFMGGYDSYIYALNIIDGNLKWKYHANALFKAAVLNSEGDIYAASFDKLLYKFDTAGNLKWTYNVNGPIESSPILYDYNNKKTYYPSITGMYQY